MTAEQQFLDMYQIDDEHASKYTGRAFKLQVDQVRARPPQRLPFPRLSPVAVWWRRVGHAFHCLSFWHSSLQRSSALGFCKRLLCEAKLPPLVSVMVHEVAWLRALRDAPGLCPGLAAALSSAAR
eukprot:1922503-Pyramimonas_sp.AAC.1